MTALFAILLFIAVTAIGAIYEGFILQTMWAWFIVPTFGLPALSIPVAIGICLIMAFLTHQIPPKSEPGREMQDSLSRMFNGFLLSTAIFFVGWVVTFFM